MLVNLNQGRDFVSYKNPNGKHMCHPYYMSGAESNYSTSNVVLVAFNLLAHNLQKI